MGITREMSKILSTSTAITTDAEISAYNYLSQSTASATYLNQTNYQPGLVLIRPTSVVNGTIGATGAVTLSSTTSVSLNSCFNSNYDCYRIILNLDPNGTGYNSITGRLRASDTDASGSNYSYYGMYVDSVSGPTRDAGANQTSLSIADSHTGGGFATVDIANPFVAKRTFFNITRNNATSANTGYQLFLVGGCHGLTTSYDGITFNFTYAQSGTIKVYGYRD